MKSNIRKSLSFISSFLLSLVLASSSVLTAIATKTTSDLESELSDLEKQQSSVSKELDHILAQIQNTSESLQATRKELAIAKGKEQAQYESMMTRIKYIYENGHSTILDMLLTSTCLAEFITRAEYYSAITEYDRKLLTEYTQNCEQIAASEEKLTEMKASLQSLQKELSQKEKALKSNMSDVAAKLQKAKEEIKNAQEQANQEIKPVNPSNNSSSNTGTNSSTATQGDGVSYTEDDVILLAGLIECEAGSSHTEGMLAVGAVVVNRMKSRYYPNTLYGVIYQPYQFPPATNGKLDRILSRGVKESCKAAARDALNGKSNVKNCVSFRAASSGYAGTIIGSNVFFF